MLARLKRTMLLTAAMLSLGAGSALADLFAIDGIPVDVRAESTSAAQAQALAQGRATGLQRVMQRLTAPSDHGRLPRAGAADLQAMTSSTQVSGEKTAPDRYIAVLSFEFEADAVRDMLRQSGIEFTESRALPTFIVPVLTSGGESSIWTDPNPWLDAWASVDPAQHLVPPVTPFGGVEDVVLLTPDQALSGDSTRILALANRYDSEAAIVVEGELSIDQTTNNASLQVRTRSIGPEPFQPVNRNFNGSIEGGVQPFLTAAARSVMDDLDRQWKALTIQRFAIQNSLTVLVPVRDLDDWIDISSRIDRVHSIKTRKLRALTVRDALLDLDYGGEPAGLQSALRRVGLQMVQQDDGFWLMTRRGAAQ